MRRSPKVRRHPFLLFIYSLLLSPVPPPKPSQLRTTSVVNADELNDDEKVDGCPIAVDGKKSTEKYKFL